MKCIIANQGEDIKLTRRGFISMCSSRRGVATNGWTPRYVGTLPPEYQLEICRECKTGDKIESGNDFTFPDFIEEIKIKDFDKIEVKKMVEKRPVGRPRKVQPEEEVPSKTIEKLDELKKVGQPNGKQNVAVAEKLAALQINLGQTVLSPSRYPTMAHWAKAVNRLSHDATLIAVEYDIQAGR